MLAQFALMVFALFAVLALVVDAGYARLTQAQMQTAADAAALEGLRKRDVGVLNPATGQTVNDPFASDCLRRAAANRVVHWVFDDDFNPSDGDPDYQFGAGPILDLTGGITNLHAGDAISVPDTHVYKPDLQLNQQNAVYGDMVSGRFCYSADPAASEGLAYADPGSIVCTEPQNGTGSYARNDFNPNAVAPQGPGALTSCPPADEAPPDPWPLPGTGSLAGVDDSAFLVRLRRTNEMRDLNAQTEANVATSGPSLPVVFGRGTTIHGDDPSGAYSARRDGLTIRATAISRVRPAMHVGLPQTGQNARPGAMPFALVDTFVQTLNAVGCPVTVTPANGTIVTRAGGAATCPAVGIVVGRFIDNPAVPIMNRWVAISTAGQTLPAAVPFAAATCAALTSPAISGFYSGYGSVYSLMASGTNRIIGFTRIGLTLAPCPAPAPAPGAALAAVISRGVSVVAASNASAILTSGLPLPISTQPAEIAELMNKNLQTNGVIYGPVLAPVLAR